MIFETFTCEFCVAAIVDPHWGQNAQMWECCGFARALLVKAVTAISTVVLSIRKGEGCSTAHTDVRVDPFRWLTNRISFPNFFYLV